MTAATRPKWDGKPIIYEGENPPTLDEGQAWFEIHERPIAGVDFDPQTQRIERVLDPELLRDGWIIVDLTPEEIEALQPRPQPVTKLTIMQRLIEVGKWEAFKAILSQAPPIAQDAWLLAQDIRADDPIFISFADAFKAGLDMTEEQFQALLAP